VENLLYLPKLRRIVAAGRLSDYDWRQRGETLTRHVHPYVIWSVEIVDGHINDDDYLVWDTEQHDPTLRMYRWFGPVEHLDQLGSLVSEARRVYGEFRETGTHVQWQVFCRRSEDEPSACILFDLDPDGNKVARTVDDRFRIDAAAGRLPDPDLLGPQPLSSLPPMVPDTD
jgi:hypothetical protein